MQGVNTFSTKTCLLLCFINLCVTKKTNILYKYKIWKGSSGVSVHVLDYIPLFIPPSPIPFHSISPPKPVFQSFSPSFSQPLSYSFTLYSLHPEHLHQSSLFIPHFLPPSPPSLYFPSHLLLLPLFPSMFLHLSIPA